MKNGWKKFWAGAAILIIPVIFFVATTQGRQKTDNKPVTPLASAAFLSQTPTPSPTPTLSPSPEPTATPEPTETPTSTPAPLPTLVPVTSEELDKWFTDYSNQYSVDRQKLWQVAVCESLLNPNAENGTYGGLFQFSESTWQTTRGVMNLDPDIALRFNPEEAIKTAAFKISTGGIDAWKNCVK